MDESTDAPPKRSSLTADWFMQGTLARIGASVDRLTGRKRAPKSSFATSELIVRLKKLLDSESRDLPQKGRIVPHNIRLSVQWDRFSDAGDSLEALERELTIAAADHINDRRYYTLAPLAVVVRPDYFTEGVRLTASFDVSGATDAELNVNFPSNESGVGAIPAAEPILPNVVLIATFTVGQNEHGTPLKVPHGRISVGRAGGNDLIIDDPSVSKFHASISIGDNGRLLLADTGSTNGTFVGGKRIAYGQIMPVSLEDRITFGSVDVRFDPAPAGDPIEEPEAAAVPIEPAGPELLEPTLKMDGDPTEIMDSETDSRE